MRPILHVFFRLEEVHAASGLSPRSLAGQDTSEADVYVSDKGLRFKLQNVIIPHPNKNRLSAVETMGIYADLGTGEKPAHGQRFQASLTVPLLLSLYCNQVIGRHI